MNKPNKGKSEVIIKLEGITKSFDQGRIQVLQGIDLEIRSGEIVALWGSSGSGKSTLLHLMGGLDLPNEGRIQVAGLDPTSEDDRLILRRKHVGFVFQLHNLIPDLSLKENCLVPSMAYCKNRARAMERFTSLTQRLGIDHREKHRIQDLSGGERQRTAICRALMHEPQVILADEPTGSLDESSGETVFNMLKELAREEGVSIVMATHERRFAEACDRVFRVRNGVASEVTTA